jgi:hypothetical protein
MGTVIVCGDYQIRSQQLNSKCEMNEVLLRHRNGWLELKEPDYHCEYYVLSCQLHSEKEKFGIGIFVENPGFPPLIVSLDRDNELLIVNNKHLTLINLRDGKICFDYQSDSTIYFAKLYMDTIVLVSELNIAQLRRNGDVIIVHTLDDVLEDIKFERDLIICRTMSSCTEFSLAKH